MIGNFTGTSLNFSTITINGNSGNDTVDISPLTSAHRIVFTSNGGVDTVIGGRAQDVVDMNDRMVGTARNDTMNGGAGNDQVFGGAATIRSTAGWAPTASRPAGNDRIETAPATTALMAAPAAIPSWPGSVTATTSISATPVTIRST